MRQFFVTLCLQVTRNPDDRCVFCGFDATMKSVLTDSVETAAGAHIVVVTRGDSTSLTNTDRINIRQYVGLNKIRVSSVLVPKNPKDFPLPFYDEVTLPHT